MCLLGQNHATGATDGAPIVNSLPHASRCCSAVGFVDSGYRTDNPHSWKTPWSSLVCSGLTGFVPSRELCLHVACSACRADSAASEMTLCWVAVRNWGVPAYQGLFHTYPISAFNPKPYHTMGTTTHKAEHNRIGQVAKSPLPAVGFLQCTYGSNPHPNFSNWEENSKLHLWLKIHF